MTNDCVGDALGVICQEMIFGAISLDDPTWNVIKAILFGPVLLLWSFYFLISNELQAVNTYRTLHDVLDQIVPFSADSVLDPKNNGKLVYVSGFINITQQQHYPGQNDELRRNFLYDETFDVNVSDAIMLRRDVKMYQWVEQDQYGTITPPPSLWDAPTTKDNHDTATYYDYKKGWYETFYPTYTFHNMIDHDNPVAMWFRSKTFYAYRTPESISIGPYTLSQAILNKLHLEWPRENICPKSNVTTMPNYNEVDCQTGPITTIEMEGEPSNTINSTNGDDNGYAKMVLYNGGRTRYMTPFKNGTRYTNPYVGDFIITHKVMYADQYVNIIGQQSGTTIIPYQLSPSSIPLETPFSSSSSNVLDVNELFLVYPGQHNWTPDTMIDYIIQRSLGRNDAKRPLGWIALLISIYVTLLICLSWICCQIRYLRERLFVRMNQHVVQLLGANKGFFGIITIELTIVIATLIIAVCWISVHPIDSFVQIVGVIGALFLFHRAIRWDRWMNRNPTNANTGGQQPQYDDISNSSAVIATAIPVDDHDQQEEGPFVVVEMSESTTNSDEWKTIPIVV